MDDLDSVETLLGAIFWMQKALLYHDQPIRRDEYEKVAQETYEGKRFPIEALEAQSSRPRDMASPTMASYLDAGESTEATTPALQLQPGDLMVADLFHAASCSECAGMLRVLLSKFRTHALAATGTNSTSRNPATPSSALSSRSRSLSNPLAKFRLSGEDLAERLD